MMNMFLGSIKQAFKCRCPKCKTGKLYLSFFDLRLHDYCKNCGLNLANNDSADGPAVFLTFVIGASILPFALWIDALFNWPLWLHTIIWGAIILGMTVGLLKPIKSYVLALHYKHRTDQWDET